MIESLVSAMEEEDSLEKYAVQVALVREPGVHDRPTLDTPEAVYRTFASLADLDRECVVAALLDGGHRLNAIHAVHIGTASQSLVGMPDVFKAAILANARGVVLIHNHPSGLPEPSNDDMELTRRVKETGELLGIPLLDHVIVAAEGYTSLRRRHAL
jgi:DNA repair protein RadC